MRFLELEVSQGNQGLLQVSNLLKVINANRASDLNAKILQFRKQEAKGEKGVDGQQGVQGIQGYTGLQGETGEEGQRGLDGQDGKDGITTVITKEVALDMSEVLKELEELKEAYEKLNNNVKGGVHGFGGGTTEARVLQMILENDVSLLNYDKMIDDESPYVYIGEAATGSLTSESLWRIKRIDSTNTPDVEIRWADGVNSFTKTWDDRATFIY